MYRFVRYLLHIAFLCLLLALSFAISAFAGEISASIAAPKEIRPGSTAAITVQVPADTEGWIDIVDLMGSMFPLIESQPLAAGENALTWRGALPTVDMLPPGQYTLQLTTAAGDTAETTVYYGDSLPALSGVAADAETIRAGAPVTVRFTASETGTVEAQVLRVADEALLDTIRTEVTAGDSALAWDGTLGGEPVEAGEYALLLSLTNDAGDASPLKHVILRVTSAEEEGVSALDFNAITASLYDASAITTRPYGTTGDDGTYWSLVPGETDEARIWSVLTQPITVYDDGQINSVGHVYLKENPDGTGRSTAQVHGLSQGLHVIGDVNEHGYVLVETFSNYDPSYHPQTPEDRYTAFDICQGYIQAAHLKTIDVDQGMALLIDKLTQRMYLFQDGVRVTELTISTGLIVNEKYFYETIPGEFITIAHGEGYWSESLFTDLPIRFNGGTMLHEVPCVIGESGDKYYGIYESRLGSKHSSGCVRVDYRENEEGYNMAWLYNNLKRSHPYKIIIWDDRNRFDQPSTWR